MALNAQQERFCVEYASDVKGNATQAAIRADYSERTASQQASRLLRDVNVKARIRELQREALVANGLGDKEALRAAVMREVVRIAMSDITDVVNISPSEDDPRRDSVLAAIAAANGGQQVIDFGQILVSPTPSLTSDVTAAIKSIKVKTTNKGAVVGLDVDMHDKLAALKTLAEIAELVKGEGTEVNVMLIDELEEARRRKLGAMTGHSAGEADDGVGD